MSQTLLRLQAKKTAEEAKKLASGILRVIEGLEASSSVSVSLTMGELTKLTNDAKHVADDCYELWLTAGKLMSDHMRHEAGEEVDKRVEVRLKEHHEPGKV